MNYFIDCGTHYFQGLKSFNEIYNFDENWKIFSFEANPLIYNKSKEYYPQLQNLYHINKAVWINEDGIEINIDHQEPLTQGSNILKNPPTKDILWGTVYNWSSQIKVETINFSNFLKQIKNEDPKCDIVIKMDIEGAEFEVLKQIIEDESYKFINSIFIEFHERFFIESVKEYEEKKNKIITFLKDKNINVYEWE